MPKGSKNRALLFLFLIKWVIEKIKSSYIPKETAIVPPLTPGIIFEIPINMPLNTNHNSFILRIHPFNFTFFKTQHSIKYFQSSILYLPLRSRCYFSMTEQTL